MVPTITIYVRHRADCRYASDAFWKRCNCRKHLRWTYQGKEHRRKAGTRSWAAAEALARTIAAEIEAAESRKPLEHNQPTTVEQAIASFMAEKAGGQASRKTLSKYRLTLSRLLDFCTRERIMFVSAITLQHLSAYRAMWDVVYSTPFALRNEQSRLRSFFNYLVKAQLIHFNPARALSAIKVTDDDFRVDPFSKAEVKKIIAAIDKTDITPPNKDRIRVLMLLQRWSGLSLIDAVTLERNGLIRTGNNFRIDCNRRKTGTNVSVPIPTWLGKELLRVKNRNEKYFFTSGAPHAISYVEKAYKRVFEVAGIVNGGSHRFRHSFAVAALEAGADIRTVSRALGHKSMAITERYYAQWSQKQQAKMEKELAAAWKS